MGGNRPPRQTANAGLSNNPQTPFGPGAQQMNTDRFSQLLDFLERLEKAKIAYSLRHSREDALMVAIRVPGELWEVEFLQDDEIEVERFRSNGRIGDASLLDVLFAK